MKFTSKAADGISSTQYPKFDFQPIALVSPAYIKETVNQRWFASVEATTSVAPVWPSARANRDEGIP
jgi:hypothetical protein